MIVFFAKVKLFTQESLQKFESIKINKIYSHFQSYLTQVGLIRRRNYTLYSKNIFPNFLALLKVTS
ncbi:hypothetical protein AVR82_17455 (plasmid) [Lactiplantibacillus plantarum]|nr:hypothetical protein AVR82_17455 [Lactiplantibacillus plantarum]